jgi:chromosome segregation protein
MRIKRLELMGFKSFMSKTSINFDEGLTGVVGPNGCGKSNIVDALLWVMGEQSPKSLRGSNMEDVIFNGSSNKKPSSLAEVSITLENDGVFPASYLNFSEITVTRRLYRNGESEYLINKVQVRLKDVKEIFMDSGARTYAVIEQGEIERIVLSKAEDRREIIEEAAGITKYKSRKDESKRKLDTTEQNLLRLNDIIAELEKQLTQLERQAKKAENYKKITGELKELDLCVGLHDYVHLDGEAASLRTALDAENNKKQEIDNNISKVELELETNKAQKLGIEEELNKLQNQTVELSTRLNTARARLEMIASEKSNIVQSADIRSSEIESLKLRIARTEHELANVDTEFSSHEEILNRANEEANKAQEVLDSKNTEYETLETWIEEKRANLLEHIQAELTAKNNISNFNERVESNKAKLERLAKEKDNYEAELKAIKETMPLLEGNFVDKQGKMKELENDLAEFKTKYEELKTELTVSEKQREEAKLELNSVNSRFEILFDLSKRLEGVSGGVKHIVESGKWNDKTRGLLAELIETSPEFEKALASVLGSSLDALVLDEGRNAVDIINSLKEEGKGQAGFLALNTKKQVNDNRAWELFGDKSRWANYLLDHVTCDERYKALVKTLLSDVYVVNDINTALDMWTASVNDSSYTLVTRDGDVVYSNGIIKGGSPDTISNSLLERKREIKELEEKKYSLVSILESAEQEYSKINSEIADVSSRLDNYNVGINGLSMELASLSKELELTRENVKRQEHRLNETNFDIDQIKFENNHLENELKSAQTILDSSGKAKEEIEAEIRDNKFKLEGISLELNSMRENVTRLKVDASTISERFRSVEERKTMLDESITTDRDRLNNFYAEGERSQNREAELTQDTEKTQLEVNSCVEELDGITRKINEVRDTFNIVCSTMADMEKNIKDMRAELNTVTGNINTLNTKLSDFSVNSGVLKQRIFDKYEVDITTMSTEGVWGDGFDKETARQKIAELNKKITDIGPVNIMAIEEYDKLKERRDFLTVQKDDLVRSMEDLKSAIKKIDDTSRVRFKATFDLVNEKFQKFFPILFGGGSAQLTLTNPDDILTTGVDIYAQLPGKKTQNINLFSGGEKSLTAISLVFSIFAIKPSPFCILDEADAPLDDANITRFNEAVRALMDRSQFILITHNKRTMEMLDTLYGVTMEDPGISRIVSVRLTENPNSKTRANGKKTSSYVEPLQPVIEQ